MRPDQARAFFLVLALAGMMMISPSCSKDQTATGPSAGSSLRPGDIAFPGMQMRPAESPTTYTLIGRIKNRASQATITEVQLKITMEDVLATGSSTTVAETMVTIHREVPPAQSVDFEEKVEFRKLPKPRGRHEWNYAVVSMKSK